MSLHPSPTNRRNTVVSSLTAIEKEAWFNSVYDLLVAFGGAREDDRFGFLHDHIDDRYPCREWRFCGLLGFGGKYRSESNRVDCYSEDSTPSRVAIITSINAKLAMLVKQ